MKYIFYIFISLILFSGLMYLLNWSIKKAEQAECVKWAQQAEEYPKFYYAEWQKEQCKIK